jgi:hydrogenase nickel incorporation protein HypB
MTSRVIVVERDVQYQPQQAAEEVRRRWASEGTLVVNLLSSPGAGKTALLEATARRLKGEATLAVLTGDPATDRDARRLAPLVPVVQLCTTGACHLDLAMVERGSTALGLQPDYLFIENVGNLVCPASFDLGEHLRVLLLSTTEGDDKPAKYAKAFRTSHALVVSKLDLLPYVPFSIEAAVADARNIQPELDVLLLSARSGQGMDAWCHYLQRKRQALLPHMAAAPLAWPMEAGENAAS